jgi:hypothetical protein
MNEIPTDFDFGFCIDSHLERITLGRHDLQFGFESGATISLDCNVLVIRDGSALAEWDDEAGWSSLAFRLLLNARVEGARVLDGSVFELQFPGGVALQLHPDFDKPESLQIRVADPSAPIIVV